MKFKNFLNEMMSSSTVKIPSNDIDILREAIIAELDAINLYSQMSRIAKDPKVKKVLKDIAFEEKVHVEEFESLLEKLDPEYESAEEQAEDEIENI